MNGINEIKHIPSSVFQRTVYLAEHHPVILFQVEIAEACKKLHDQIKKFISLDMPHVAAGQFKLQPAVHRFFSGLFKQKGRKVVSCNTVAEPGKFKRVPSSSTGNIEY